MRKARPALAFVTALAVAGAASAQPPSRAKPRREAKMTTNSYPTYFASPRRDSLSPAASGSKGELGWKKDLGLTEKPVGRPRLLAGNDGLVVEGAVSFAGYTLAGEKSWERTKMMQSPVGLAGGRAYFETRSHFLGAVDAAGKLVVLDAPLPGSASEETKMRLLWPQAKDFVTVMSLSDPTYDEEDPGNAQMEPQAIVRRSVYGSSTSDFGGETGGVEKLPALYLPDQQRLLTVQDQVNVWDVTSEEETPAARLALPLPEPAAWSADAEGTLVMAGVVVGDKKVKRKALVAFGLDGAERWRWTDVPENSDAWVKQQPPVRAAKGRVVVLTSRRVLALEKGKPVWSLDLAEEAKGERYDAPSWATALPDGTLLLVTGGTVRLLDEGGKARWSVPVGAAVTSPPVVGGDGNVYVVTESQLVQIK